MIDQHTPVLLTLLFLELLLQLVDHSPVLLAVSQLAVELITHLLLMLLQRALVGLLLTQLLQCTRQGSNSTQQCSGQQCLTELTLRPSP